MEVQTSRFGPLDLPENTFIEFPWGLPGFETSKRFVLLEHREGPFQWLQAVDQPEVAFVVCPPEVMGLHYTVPPDKQAPIGIQQDQDLLLLVLVSFDRATGNLRPHVRGPLLFNAANRKGYQWSLENGELPKYLCSK
ncbi:MAG: hypothetical protein AUK55_00655 [Syntrophobacteraceae bacterium CG2_30_61_12]|nr:MAG: hypothetical protein AUK55_00655 [Syntrophobacteraceae bacterium CG2_30_61_12]PIU32521.1 MAG: hypothetical protein COT06_02285 [Syntrophobacteraceae bacterium CG07_land_8_20_14_0_80_61_8]